MITSFVKQPASYRSHKDRILPLTAATPSSGPRSPLYTAALQQSYKQSNIQNYYVRWQRNEQASE